MQVSLDGAHARRPPVRMLLVLLLCKHRTSTSSALQRLSKSLTAATPPLSSPRTIAARPLRPAVHPPSSLVFCPSLSCPHSYYVQGGICIRGIESRGLFLVAASENQHGKALTRWAFEGYIPSIGACRVGSVYGRAEGGGAWSQVKRVFASEACRSEVNLRISGCECYGAGDAVDACFGWGDCAFGG